MARIARVVVPGLAYHLTHRGNRRQPIFFRPSDRDVYRCWLEEYSDFYGLSIWAYCLMTNHVHLLAVGKESFSLAKTMACCQGRYAAWVNHRYDWSGHLWANRFYSTLLDDTHLWTAVKYVELNPVRAGLVSRAEDWPWSSTRAHAWGRSDSLLSSDRPFPGPVRNWSAWLSSGFDEAMADRIRQNTKTGRPSGGKAFIEGLEAKLGRPLRPARRGPRVRVSRDGNGRERGCCGEKD